MSDAYNPFSFIFSDDPKTGALTYEQLQARRKIAAALATRNRGYPKNIGEGLTALGEGIAEGRLLRGLERAEVAQTARDRAASGELLGGAPTATPAPVVPPAARAAPGPLSMDTGTDPEGAVLASATGAAPDAMDALALASPADIPAEPKQKFPALSPEVAARLPKMPIPELKRRLARAEGTMSEPDPYRVVGERSLRGDYPYGKYAVMGERIPQWSKEYLGREMTPQQFLDDDKAQEEIASARAGYYQDKYGPNGAAAAWFAGENGMNDPKRMHTLGRHVDEYVKRFNIPLVDREQVVASVARGGDGAPPVRLAALGGAPTPDTAPGDPRSAIAATLAQGPQGPMQPTPVPQPQVAQAAPVPQQIQRAPVEPPRPVDPGPEPTLRSVIGSNPAIVQQMETARRYALDPNVSPAIQAQAQARYQELEKRANDAYTKQWTIWHERTKVKEAWELAAEERERTRQTHQQKVPQQPAPAPPSPTAGPDPRLGTPESPQRTRIPTMPPLPPGQPPDKWAEEQRPLMAKSLEAVDKATPLFDDALTVIHKARTHPGREWGIGATGEIAQKLPWTDAAGFGLIVNQLKGKNFLAGYQQLRGAGNISEIEGVKTEQAQARVSTAQNKRDFDDALNDLEKSMRRDLELAQRKVNAPVTAWRAPGDNASFAPDIGERRGNNEYIGGNPSEPSSWKRIR